VPLSVAIQLYSLRQECERDLVGTLADLADIGYRRVEFDRVYGDPREAGEALRSLRMSACGLHAPLERIEDHPQAVVDAALALRTRRVIVSFVPRPLTPEIAEGLRGRLDAAAALLQTSGIVLAYHSHDWDLSRWEDGRRPFDIVAGARRILLEPDLGWVWEAGEDPVEFVRAQAGRCPLVHIKDFTDRSDRDSTCAVGSGIAPCAEILAAAPEAGVEGVVVEFNHPGRDSVFDAAQKSLDWIRARLAEGNG
jgi:sugar phosphate isomerase/epimerase